MVQVYQASNVKDPSCVTRIADLLMGQMESIGSHDPYSELLQTIRLALEENSNAHIFVAEKENTLVGAAFFKCRP